MRMFFFRLKSLPKKQLIFVLFLVLILPLLLFASSQKVLYQKRAAEPKKEAGIVRPKTGEEKIARETIKGAIKTTEGEVLNYEIMGNVIKVEASTKIKQQIQDNGRIDITAELLHEIPKKHPELLQPGVRDILLRYQYQGKSLTVASEIAPVETQISFVNGTIYPGYGEAWADAEWNAILPFLIRTASKFRQFYGPPDLQGTIIWVAKDGNFRSSCVDVNGKQIWIGSHVLDYIIPGRSSWDITSAFNTLAHELSHIWIRNRVDQDSWEDLKVDEGIAELSGQNLVDKTEAEADPEWLTFYRYKPFWGNFSSHPDTKGIDVIFRFYYLPSYFFSDIFVVKPQVILTYINYRNFGDETIMGMDAEGLKRKHPVMFPSENLREFVAGTLLTDSNNHLLVSRLTKAKDNFFDPEPTNPSTHYEIYNLAGQLLLRGTGGFNTWKTSGWYPWVDITAQLPNWQTLGPLKLVLFPETGAETHTSYFVDVSQGVGVFIDPAINLPSTLLRQPVRFYSKNPADGGRLLTTATLILNKRLVLAPELDNYKGELWIEGEGWRASNLIKFNERQFVHITQITEIPLINNPPQLTSISPSNGFSTQTLNPVTFTATVKDPNGVLDLQAVAFGLAKKGSAIAVTYPEKFLAVRIDKKDGNSPSPDAVNVLDRPGQGVWWQYPKLSFGSDIKIYFNHDETNKTTISYTPQTTSFAYIDLKNSGLRTKDNYPAPITLEARFEIKFLDKFSSSDYDLMLWAKDQSGVIVGWTKMGEWQVIQPKACGITNVTRSSQYQSSPLTVSFSGNARSSDTQKVRLWVEKKNPTERIEPLPGQPSPGELLTSVHNGITYYWYQAKTCDSANNQECQEQATVSLPSGEYYFHCSIRENPGRCNGSPFCSYNNGSLDCGNFVSCGPSDATEIISVLLDYPLSVKVIGQGKGLVSSTRDSPSPAIKCGSFSGFQYRECSKSYPPNTTVKLYAATDLGSTFMGWSGDCQEKEYSSNCTVSLDKAHSVTAIFEPTVQ